MSQKSMDASCPAEADVDFSKPFYYSGGSLRGHQLPGSFMLIWGFWQTFHIIRCYYMALKSKDKLYVSVPWYGYVRGFPIEPFFKIFFPLCGVALEIGVVHSYRPIISADNLFINSNVYQHVCMYSTFCMSGLVDMLGLITSIPEDAEKAMLALCFALEGTLIFFHLGTPELSTQSHMFMVIIVYSTVFAILGELMFPHNVLLSLMRGAAIIFQGLWWHAVGRILYGEYKYWHPCYHGSVMMVSMSFGFTALFVILIVMILYALVFLLMSTTDICHFTDPNRFSKIDYQKHGGKSDAHSSNYYPVETAELSSQEVEETKEAFFKKI